MASKARLLMCSGACERTTSCAARLLEAVLARRHLCCFGSAHLKECARHTMHVARHLRHKASPIMMCVCGRSAVPHAVLYAVPHAVPHLVWQVLHSITELNDLCAMQSTDPAVDAVHRCSVEEASLLPLSHICQVVCVHDADAVRKGGAPACAVLEPTKVLWLLQYSHITLRTDREGGGGGRRECACVRAFVFTVRIHRRRWRKGTILACMCAHTHT